MDERGSKAKAWRAVCTVCEKTFGYTDGFECDAKPGRHAVASKTYYHLGAGHIQNMRERRLFAPTLNLKANLELRDKVTGQITNTEGVLVHFKQSGIFETSDPQEQYYLDQHPAVMTGEEGRAEWEKMYLTPTQQLDKANMRLADVQRQLREGNALLDAVKTRQGQGAPAPAGAPARAS